jgi:hypothetical protein
VTGVQTCALPICHPRARNKPGEIDYVLTLIRAWLAAQLNDDPGDEPAPVIYAALTRPRDQAFDPGDVIKVATFAELSTAVLTKRFERSAVLLNPASGIGGFPSDPLLQAGLEAGLVGAGELKPYTGPVPVPDAPDPTAAQYHVAVASLTGGSELLIAGQPTITLQASTDAARVQLNVRLFDVEPGGARQLISRGTYTLDSGGLGAIGTVQVTIRTQGNLWRAASNHMLQLEVSNADAPYMAPSRIGSETQISNVQLDIPVR